VTQPGLIARDGRAQKISPRASAFEDSATSVLPDHYDTRPEG
jgi:hypothetical protein